MNKTIGLLAALLLFSLPTLAQRGEEHGGGHPAPARGPAPVRSNPHPVEEHRNFSEAPRHPNAPHVDGNKWVGHDTGRNDPHYHLDHAWEHGHFRGGLARITFGTSWEAVRVVSGSAGSTSALLRTTWAIAKIGTGPEITSSSTTTRITLDGIWPTTSGWEPTFT